MRPFFNTLVFFILFSSNLSNGYLFSKEGPPQTYQEDDDEEEDEDVLILEEDVDDEEQN